MEQKTVVLGLGNTIMSDDGIGPLAISILSTKMTSLPPNIELLDGGTLGLDLLPRLEGVHRLLVVDAVETGGNPGDIVRLAGDEVPIALETKLSPHQMGMKDLLAVASLMDCLPEEIVLLGMQPGCLEIGTDLSPEVEANMPSFVKIVSEEMGVALPE